MAEFFKFRDKKPEMSDPLREEKKETSERFFVLSW